MNHEEYLKIRKIVVGNLTKAMAEVFTVGGRASIAHSLAGQYQECAKVCKDNGFTEAETQKIFWSGLKQALSKTVKQRAAKQRVKVKGKTR